MLLRTEQLTKRFGGLTAVSNLNIAIEQGTIAAIIGPNGAGKTTAFNLISGFHGSTEGKIFFSSENITDLPPHKRALKGIARTFQTTALYTKSTVLDNVLLGHRLRTNSNLLDIILHTPRFFRDEKACLDKALEVLEFMEIAHLSYEKVENISQEARKRLAIALALATDPKLILLDEPAAGINYDETEGLIEQIKKIQKKGLTICLIEHKMNMIMNLANKIFVLNYGNKIAEGTPGEIIQNPVVIEAYLGGKGHA